MRTVWAYFPNVAPVPRQCAHEIVGARSDVRASQTCANTTAHVLSGLSVARRVSHLDLVSSFRFYPAGVVYFHSARSYACWFLNRS